jgi:hypothetical protein
MYDLTPFLLEARKRAAQWSKDACAEIANFCLDTIPETRLSWDRGAGEDWAGILTDKEPVAIIRVDAPLVFIGDKYINEVLSGRLQEKQVVTVAVPDMNARLYKLDISLLDQMFPGETWPFDAVDPNGFSILELHWATI